MSDDSDSDDSCDVADPTTACSVCCCSSAAPLLRCPQCATLSCVICLARRGTHPVNACWSCPRNFTLDIEDARRAVCEARSRVDHLLRPWLQLARTDDLGDEARAHLLVAVQSIAPRERAPLGGAGGLDAVHRHVSALAAAEAIALEAQSISCRCGVRVSVYDIDFDACMALTCTCGRHLCAVCGTMCANADIAHDHVRIYHAENLFMTQRDYFRCILQRARALAISVAWMLDADLALLRAPLRETFTTLRRRVAVSADARIADEDIFQLQDECASAPPPPPAESLGALPAALLADHATPALLRTLVHALADDLEDARSFMQLGGAALLEQLTALSAGCHTFPHKALRDVVARVALQVSEDAATDAQLAMLSLPCGVLVAVESVALCMRTHDEKEAAEQEAEQEEEAEEEAEEEEEEEQRPRPRPRRRAVGARSQQEQRNESVSVTVAGAGWRGWTCTALALLLMSPLHAAVAVKDTTAVWRRLLRAAAALDCSEIDAQTLSGIDANDCARILLHAAQSDREAVEFWHLLQRPRAASAAVGAADRFLRALDAAACDSDFARAAAAVIATGALTRAVGDGGDAFAQKMIQLGGALSLREVALICDALEPHARVAAVVALAPPRARETAAVLAGADENALALALDRLLTSRDLRLRLLERLLHSRSHLHALSNNIWDRFDARDILELLQRRVQSAAAGAQRRADAWSCVNDIAHLIVRAKERRRRNES